MQYDQSWMGYGIVGGLQAGSIAALAAMLLFGFFHWLGRRNGWSYGPQIGWTFLSAALLTVSGDLWNLFYFNYAQLQSLQLLKAKLQRCMIPMALGPTQAAADLNSTSTLGLWRLTGSPSRTRAT